MCGALVLVMKTGLPSLPVVTLSFGLAIINIPSDCGAGNNAAKEIILPHHVVKLNCLSDKTKQYRPNIFQQGLD